MRKILLILITILFASIATAQFVTVDDVELDINSEASVENGADFTINAEGQELTEVRLYYDTGSGFFSLHESYACNGDSCTVNENFDYGEEGTVEFQAEAYADDINRESDIHEVEFKEDDFGGGDAGEFEIVSSNAEHVDSGNVEMTLELDEDLPGDYTCRWSENSDVTAADSTMDRESDTEFEASSNFDDGDQEVWMGCLSDTGSLVTDAVKESFEVQREEHELTVKIYDDKGYSESGVTVKIDGREKETGSRGEVNFDLAAGDYTVEASKEGFRTVSKNVGLDEDKTIELYLENDGKPEVVSSNARHIGDGKVEFELKFDRGLDEDYSCRWSENSDITISDQVLDQEDDDEFEGSGQFNKGDHKVWMGCLVDGELETEKVSEEFNVDDLEDDIEAEFDYRPSNPEINEEIEFDASDSEGDIDNYEWDFGDGNSDEGREVTHSYSSSGWYSVTLTVENNGNEDSTTRTVRADDEDADGELEVTVRDDEDERLEDARVTAMALEPSNFVSRSSDKDDYSRGSSNSKVGDSEIGFELDDDELETYVRYHSGYSSYAWNNLALESSDGNRLLFRYDLAAENRQRTYREYGASQETELSSGEKEVTVILTLNGDEVDSFTSRIDVADDHEFSKKKDSGDVSYDGRDRRTGNTPQIPSYTGYTDDDGEAFFNMPAGRYTVTATKPRYSSERENIGLEKDEDEELDLELDRLSERPEDPEDPENPDDERIEIESIKLPDSVCRGGDVNARVTVENTGDDDLDFGIAATGLSSDITRIYYLDEGEKDTKIITFSNVQGSGNEVVSFSTGYDSQERVIQVRDCDRGEGEGLSVSINPTELQVTDTLRVSGIVDGAGRREVDISVAGVYKQSVSTEPDGRFQAYVQPHRTGRQDVVVETGQASRTRRISVLPTVNVHSVSVPDRPFEGESFNVCGNIESQTAPLVILKKNGDIVETKNGRGNICFERTESSGDYRYEIQAFNQGVSDSASNTVEVLESDVEARSFPDQIASVQSGSGVVKVELYNNRDGVRNYVLELEGLPENWIAQSRKEVVLDKGERKTEYIYFTPELEGDFEASLRVSSEGEQIHSENIKVSSGGTNRSNSLWERILLWFRYG